MTLATWIRQQTRRLPGGRPATSPLLAETRLIVLDADVTGINRRRDHATGIAILGVEHGEFTLGGLEYCQLTPDPEQPTDDRWRNRYRTLLDTIAERPVLTYNARFVKHMIKRAAQLHNLPLPYAHWIDIASALHGAFGAGSNEVESMRHWQQQMRIAPTREHDAVADVFALAQLLQTMLPYCADVGITTMDDLQRAQDARVWLRG